MGDYINSPFHKGKNVLKKRENSRSGQSKVFCMVGVSFGLLCIVQSALNVSLRLYGIGSTKSGNITTMTTNDVSTLLREKDQLLQENRELQANNTMLNDQLSQQKDLIMELQTEKEMLVMRLSDKAEQSLYSCPPGWMSYMSSCYLLSTEKKNWRSAEEDCVEKGGHLVILNDKSEENVLHNFASSVVWIGLKTDSDLETWTWVDGSTLTYGNSIQSHDIRPGDQHYYCIYSEQCLGSVRWVRAACADKHHWVCERAMK